MIRFDSSGPTGWRLYDRPVGRLAPVLDKPRIRSDGTVIVHSHEASYRAVARLSAMASDVVERDVHVITDDVPGAAGAQEL